MTPEQSQEIYDKTAARRCKRGARVFVDLAAGHLVVVPLTCKSWSCPYCAKRQRAKWAERITRAKPQWFLTLTRDPRPGWTPQQTYEYMCKGFPKLVAAIRNKIGNFEFCAIWELHEDGFPHLHVAWSGAFLPLRWLSAILPKFNFGPVCRNFPIQDTRKLGLYVAKYMAKTMGSLSRPVRFRRIIWHSKKFFAGVKAEDLLRKTDTWQVIRTRQNFVDLLEHVQQSTLFLLTDETRVDRFCFCFPPGFLSLAEVAFELGDDP